MNLKTPIFVCSLFVLLFLSSVENVFACTCVEEKNSSHNQKVREAYRQSTAIFAGRVVRIDATSNPTLVFITIQVFDAWKGNIPPTIVIATNKGADACEFPFDLGADYLIYTIGAPNTLHTNFCLRTAILPNNPDVPILNKITRRTP